MSERNRRGLPGRSTRRVPVRCFSRAIATGTTTPGRSPPAVHPRPFTQAKTADEILASSP
ncbi:MAG TPA: hypothetical protein VFQ68_05915 [Streptosporangiaceae bacterium]|nr:hypothetical protein [Streptosporangiaceae bacterium]